MSARSRDPRRFGNAIPESYLARFLPVRTQDRDGMPADIAAFVRSVTGKERSDG